MPTAASRPAATEPPKPKAKQARAAASAARGASSSAAAGPEAKRRRKNAKGGENREAVAVGNDSAPTEKPVNRKRFLRFLKAHELKFALEPVARDECSGEVTLVVCRFCQHFGREQRPDKQRRSTKNLKYFRNSFRTDQYQQHHELSHGETWARYQACTDEEKRAFFPASSATDGVMTTAPSQSGEQSKPKVELAPGEVWALEPTREERNRCFEVTPAIVELVAVLAIGATEPTVEKVIEKQSHHVMDHAHEPLSTVVARWCPPPGTFQSCSLVGTAAAPLYRVVAYSRSQVDCLVELTAAGLSFRQISHAMRSFRSHAPAILSDLVANSSGLGNDAAIASAEKQFRVEHGASPQYNEEQTAEFVRLIIAASMHVTSRLLRGSWAFSLELRASMQHAPVRSYLDVRVKVYGAGAIHNVHLLAIPTFENKCKVMMYQTLERVLTSVLPNWRRRLLGVATNGNAQMPPRVLDIVARLQQEAQSPVVYRSSRVCHQMDRIVANFYSSLQGGCFLLTLKEFSAYVRRQPELLMSMGSQIPLGLGGNTCSSESVKQKWVALGEETNWLTTHRDLLWQHFEERKPPSTPDNSWWLFFAAVNWVATRVNETFAELLRKRATVADQVAAIVRLVKDCSVAFHVQDPLDESSMAVADSTSANKKFTSRKGHFAVSKANMMEFVKEASVASSHVINSTEVPVVDLVMENLAICGVSMLESLLELSANLDGALDPTDNSGSITTASPKVTEILPPMLPHEMARLSGREFAALMQTHGPVIRDFLTEEDIDMMDQELQSLRRGAMRESVLSAALAKCNEDTPFEEAWAPTERRFKRLEAFAGGFASVFACDPIAVTGGTGDLALCQSDMDTARVLLTDFALEGALHAQQFPALVALREQLDAAQRAEQLQLL
ncbi:hypothetical protein BBJ28_00014599 [Nothophytophthora sp. Chile5]|nr:hypothetical protein BBJ28_00014599 [Nothophytophthora sp. Chile5]